MPISQLKRKNNEKNSHGFTTHRIGSDMSREKPVQPRPVGPRREPSSWAELFNSDTPRRPKGPRRRRMRKIDRALAMMLVRIGLFVALLGGIFFITVVAWYSKDLPDPNKIIERDIAQSTKIFDRTGTKLLYEIHGTERRTLIELSAIPQYAIDATIAIEDKNFYKHKGLSLPGIAKAILLEIASRTGLYRGLVPGGSTLTQQFIKNAVLTTEKSYSRKIKEFVLAYRMERKFTKDQILKLYFNEIPYGSTAYGIEAASHIYFDKSAKDLTLAEAAILAAMPQAPSYYSPSGSHRDELIGRQRYVLKLMVEQQYITQEQADQAKNEELVFKKRREDILAPHFVFMVKEELSGKYGERLVEQGGLKIITTLDLDKQKAAETAVAEMEKSNAEKYNANNASLVSIDVKTGEILAMVGSKDYFNDDIDGQVNVATSLRQPGSSLKPLIYAEAFNRGYRPDTTEFDLVTRFSTGSKEYKPLDYDGKERGPVTLRQALQGSLNIPGVKMLYLIGVRRAVELAQELGYTSLIDPDRYGLSLVLGGGEVKLVEHTNAYAAYAREGVYKPSVSVLRVEDQNHAVLEEHHDTEGKRVLPREVVRQLSNVLSDNEARAYIFGASNYLTLPDRPVAAKTGTTNNYHDAWTLGYTPGIATGVWVGNSDNTEMKQRADGSVVAAPIWKKYMTAVLAGTPVESFKSPEPLPACDRPMLCGNPTGERQVRINMDNGKLAGPFTPPSKIKVVTYREIHSILYYVNKNDPAGPPPENPGLDPQYSLWEEPIQQWAAKQGFINEQPPTEVDTSYQAADQPSVSWIQPLDGATLTSINNPLAVQASGPHGIAKVDYYLNAIFLGSATQSPYNFTLLTSPQTPNGSYTLTARAFDSLGNENSASIRIVLNAPVNPDQWAVTWLQPMNGGSFTPSTLPGELKVSVLNPSLVKKIDFYLKKSGSSSYLGYQEIKNQSSVSLSWSKPQTPGTYSLYLVVTDTSNTVVTIPEITVTLLNE